MECWEGVGDQLGSAVFLVRVTVNLHVTLTELRDAQRAGKTLLLAMSEWGLQIRLAFELVD